MAQRIMSRIIHTIEPGYKPSTGWIGTEWRAAERRDRGLTLPSRWFTVGGDSSPCPALRAVPEAAGPAVAYTGRPSASCSSRSGQGFARSHHYAFLQYGYCARQEGTHYSFDWSNYEDYRASRRALFIYFGEKNIQDSLNKTVALDDKRSHVNSV